MRTSRTEWLIKDCEWLSAEEKEIVLFGLMQGRSLINSIAVTILLGLLMGLLWESVLFVICFLPLRRYAGGFHAKTREGCLFFSVTIVVAAFFVIKYLRCENWIIAAASLRPGHKRECPQSPCKACTFFPAGPRFHCVPGESSPGGNKFHAENDPPGSRKG